MANTTYATIAQLKPRVTIRAASTDSDPLLQDLLNQAAAFIDGATRGYRVGYEAFSASASETRTFDDALDGIVPIDDLLTISAVTRGGTAVTSDYYKLWPANALPRLRLYLRLDATVLTLGIGGTWYDSPIRGAGLQQIAITGTWGYSTTVPPAITGLTLTLAERLYERLGRMPIDPVNLSVNPDVVLDRYLLAGLKPFQRQTHTEMLFV